MKLYRWPGDNLGDRPLNDWLVPRLFPRLGQPEPDKVMVAVGTILSHRPRMPAEWQGLPWVVYGAGWQAEYGPLDLPADVTLYAVRGRQTSAALRAVRPELVPPLAYGDPAILLPHWLPRDAEPGGDTLTVQKWDYDGPETSTITTARTDGDFVGWCRRLWTAKNVVTDSLHAAVIADAYGIPWVPLRWETKWADHFNELGVTDRPTTFTVTDRDRLARMTAELQAAGEKLRGDQWQ